MIARIRVNSRLAGALAWLVLTLVAVALVAAVNLARLGGDFDAEARNLHRIVSQRADQHDAHLTSLAAILASPGASLATLRGVAEAVQRFYPRIKAIEVLALGNAPQLAFSTQEIAPGQRNDHEIAALAKDLSPGQTVLAYGGGETYQLVKGLPASQAQGRALIMAIDARRLVEPEGAPTPATRLVLKTPSGGDIVAVGDLDEGALAAPAFTFEKALGSRSQPLLLTMARRPGVRDILPPLEVALAVAGAGLCVLLGLFVLRERRTAREARERASFHEQAARLAHAMRVNTVGEMASGIAHELTQPLTAILSQSQAGLRLAQGRHLADHEAIIGVLEANARLARRAGDILARLRAYVSNKTPAPELTDLNQVVSNVVQLAQADLSARGVLLALDLSPEAPASMIDRVSIEQVVHNLVRNAADAVERLPQERRTVSIVTAREGETALISVSDNGPGIAPDSLARVFEPFFTTKEQGMGLGLPLCERLVEAFGGQMTVASQPARGAAFTVRLPLSAGAAKEAAE